VNLHRLDDFLRTSIDNRNRTVPDQGGDLRGLGRGSRHGQGRRRGQNCLERHRKTPWFYAPGVGVEADTGGAADLDAASAKKILLVPCIQMTRWHGNRVEEQIRECYTLIPD